MSKRYEVEVDGNVEETTRKSDVVETLLEAVSDGETHEISVAQVDDSVDTLDKNDDKVVDNTPPSGGIQHLR